MKGFFKKQEVSTPKKKRVVQRKVSGCESCMAYSKCKNGKFAVSGTGENNILLITDTVSSQEEETGIAGSGITEKYLKARLAEVGVVYEECWHTRAIRCYIKGADPKNATTAQKNGCKYLLASDIKRLKPQKIFAFGELAVELLYGERAQKSRIGGGNAERYYGCKIPDQDIGCLIFPLYPPRFPLEALSRRMGSLKKYNRYKKEDVPLWEHSVLSQADEFRIRDIYFKKYLKEAVQHDKPFVKTNYVNDNCVSITDVNEAIQILKEMRTKKVVGLDSETNMLKPFSPESELLSIGVSDGNTGYGFDFFGDNEEFCQALEDLITDPNVKTVYGNLTMEALWFKEFLGVWITNAFWDLVICSHMLLPTIKKKNSLKFNMLRYEGVLGYDSDAEEYISGGKGDKPSYTVNRMKEMPLIKRNKYVAMDALSTVKVVQHQYKEMASDKKMYPLFKTYMEGAMLFSKTCYRGFNVKEDVLIKNMEKAENKVLEYDYKIKNCAEAKKWNEINPNKELNVNSNDVLRELFYDILGFTTKKKTKSGQLSVDSDTLELFTDKSEIAGLITERSTWLKISEVLEGIRKNTMNSKIHPEILLFVASTGRSSSSNLNFQNIPLHNPLYSKEIRSCLCAPDGKEIVDYDFQALEKRLAYSVHEDPVFLQELQGADSHAATAEYIFLDNEKATKRVAELLYPDKESFTEAELEKVFEKYIRKPAKPSGFALQYGCSPNKLSSTLWDVELKDAQKQYFKEIGIDTEEKFSKHAQQIFTNYWERFKVQWEWREREWQKYLERGYSYSLAGWRMSGIASKNLLLNSLVQGVGLYITLLAALKVEKDLTGFKSTYNLSIHDAGYFFVDPEEYFNGGVKEIIENSMTTYINETVPWLKFPMDAGPEYTLGDWYTESSEEQWREVYEIQ